MDDVVSVLLVEDDEVDAEYIRRSIARAPGTRFDVTHAASLAEASEVLGEVRYDVVLLDLSLPDAAGIDTVRQIVGVAAEVPVIVLTGSDDDALASEALRVGAQDYLVKGVADDLVPRSIRYSIERKRSDAERRQIEERLSDVQKLESLGLLAGGIAHDFNNLLTGILGHSSLCLLRVPRGSVLEESLQQIERSAVRAGDLCKQLLAYSGKGRFVVTAVDLSELVAEMVNILELSISSRAVLRCDLAQGLPVFEAAATQVRQVVMNLITNASDALKDGGGAISIRTGVMECDDQYLTSGHVLEALPAGRYVFVEVSDTGVGMDEHTREHLFDPFFSTKGHGRGLGLAAVLGIVRSHHAALKVYSEPGRGSTFKVLFPAPGDVRRPAGDAADALRTAGRCLGLVLVVDDEVAVRNVARSVLRDMGFQVVEAEDGVAALAEMRALGADVSLVLLDMTMPRMDGQETFRELRRMWPAVKVLLSSGYNEQDAIAAFAGKGLAGFIQKPYSAQALMAAVRAVMDGGQLDKPV